MPRISYRTNVKSTCLDLTAEKLQELVEEYKTEYNTRMFRRLMVDAVRCVDAKERTKLEAQAKQFKCLLPMVVWQGHVPEGEMPTNDNVELTGLYATDWDHLSAQGAGVKSEKLNVKGSTRASRGQHATETALRLAREIAARADELGLVMVHVSPSGDGVRAVGRCQPQFQSLEENQQWLSAQFGLENDPVTCNVGRTWFLPMKEDVVYLNLEALAEEPPTPLRGRKQSGEEGASVISSTLKEIVSPSRGLGGLPSSEVESMGSAPNESVPEARESCLRAFDLCVRKAGLDPERMDVWGEHNWHNNLMSLLSLGLPKLMPREQLRAVVAVKLPNYSRTKDCEDLIRHFYEKYNADTGFMTHSLREINAEMQRVDVGNETADAYETPAATKRPRAYENDDDNEDVDDNENLGDAGSYALTAPPLLPPAVQVFVDASATEAQKGAAAMMAMMAFSVLLSRLRSQIRHTSVEIVANFLLYLWGNSSVGKTSLARWVLWTILGGRDDMTLDTLHGMDNLFLKTWTDAGKKQQALGNGAKRGITTEDYPMRIVSNDITSAGLFKHFRDAQELHSLIFVADHDMLVANTGMAAWRKMDSDLRTLYDAEWMTKKTGTLNGISGRARAMGSAAICGTGVDVHTYYQGKGMQILKGLGNRTCFLHLTADYFNRQWPRQLTQEELELVRRTARRAMDETVRVTESFDDEGEAHYEVEVQPLRQVEMDWLWHHMEDAFVLPNTVQFLLDDRETCAEILARCKETAVRAGMVMYWLWGCRDDEETRQRITDAAMWVANTMMNGMLELFQEQLDRPALQLSLSMPQATVWDDMPDVFDVKMLSDTLLAHGRRTKPALVIHQWSHLPLKGYEEPGVIVKVGRLYYKRGSEAEKKATGNVPRQQVVL